MTNRDKWQEYTKGLPSPQNYIDWTWRYIVAASLQRRVWLPPAHQPCFANQYTILVGRAGLGKGLCIREASDFLKHWKLKDALLINKDTFTLEQKTQINSIHEKDLQKAKEDELQPKNKKNQTIEPLLIPVAADATTYEALVAAVAESYRRINFVDIDPTTQQPKLAVYGHSSICFSLQELASLLRKRTDDTVNYMLGLYDCPLDYEYDTKTQGKDRVRRGCLNLLAGTTPDFMQDILSAKLINQGFGSRNFFIYANKDRKTQFWIPELTEEQKAYKKELLEHIRKLTTLYGQIKMSDEVKNFLEEWWRENADKRSNSSNKLDGYYSRKKVHIMKVAMAEHFSESMEMDIPVETYKKAIEILAKEEKSMHLAIVLEGPNAAAGLSHNILELLRGGCKNFVDIHVATFHLGSRSQCEEAIGFLLETDQISKDTMIDADTEEQKTYYRLKGNNGD